MYPASSEARNAHDRGDLLGSGEAAERHGGRELGLPVLGKRGRHVGGDGPGSDDVHRDRPRRELSCERPGQADKAGLRRGVVRLPRRAEEPDDRRHEDHPPAPSAHHPRRRPLREAIGAGEVRVDTLVNCSSLMRKQQAVVVDAGIRDEHLDRPVSLLDGGEGRIDVGHARHVALQREEVVGRRLRRVGDGDSVAVRLECPCAREPDAPRPAGDQDRARLALWLRHSAPHRITALADVMPAPNPTSRMRSPSCTRSCVDRVDEREGDRCRRRVAGAVEHRRDPVHRDAEPGRRGLDDAEVRLMRHDEREVVDRDAGLRRATSWPSRPSRAPRGGRPLARPSSCSRRHPRTAAAARRRRNARSQPSSCPRPSTASSTTAPAPSANRIAVPRSSQSTIRDSVSAPTTRILSAPAPMKPCAATRA